MSIFIAGVIGGFIGSISTAVLIAILQAGSDADDMTDRFIGGDWPRTPNE